MHIQSAIPNAPQGRHLIEPGAFARLQGQAGVSPQRKIEDVQLSQLFRRGVIILDGRELVAGVQRRNVALHAPFANKNFLPFRCLGVKRIRVWRRGKGGDVSGKGIEQFIG